MSLKVQIEMIGRPDRPSQWPSWRHRESAARGAALVGAYQFRHGRSEPERAVRDIMVDLLHWLSREGHNPDGALVKAAARYSEETR